MDERQPNQEEATGQEETSGPKEPVPLNMVTHLPTLDKKISMVEWRENPQILPDQNWMTTQCLFCSQTEIGAQIVRL